METSTRFIANTNIAVNPSPLWGFDINYNNFGMQTESGTLPINDSVRIKQVNQTLTVAPRFNIIEANATHSLSMAICYNDVNDRNTITKQYGNMKAEVINLNHNTTFNKKGNSINSGINYNKISTASFNNSQLGFTVGYSHSFFKQALSASINANYNFSTINGEKDGNILNATFAANYSYRKHSFSVNFNLINTVSKQFDGYTETMATLGYNFRIK